MVSEIPAEAVEAARRAIEDVVLPHVGVPAIEAAFPIASLVAAHHALAAAYPLIERHVRAKVAAEIRAMGDDGANEIRAMSDCFAAYLLGYGKGADDAATVAGEDTAIDGLMRYVGAPPPDGMHYVVTGEDTDQ